MIYHRALPNNIHKRRHKIAIKRNYSPTTKHYTEPSPSPEDRKNRSMHKILSK